MHKGNGTAHRITADKREIEDFPKLPSATYFIRRTLYVIGVLKKNRRKRYGKKSFL